MDDALPFSMAHETRTEAQAPDLDRLADLRDENGRKTYLSIYADLTDKDWEMAIKSHVETTRRGLDKIEAESVHFHQAFDRAYLALERLAKQGAKGGVVFVSAVHDIEMVHALDQPIENRVVLDERPDIAPLE